MNPNGPSAGLLTSVGDVISNPIGSVTNAAETAAQNATEYLSSAVNSIAHPATGEQVQGSLSNVAGELTLEGSNNAVVTSGQPTVSNVLDMEQIHGSTDDFYSNAYEPGVQAQNIDKLMHLGTGTFTTAKTNGDIILSYSTPLCFMNYDDQPARGQCRYFRYWRGGMSFTLHVHSPLGGCGILVLSWLPPGTAEGIDWANGPKCQQKFDYTTMLNLPHAICNLMDSNSVTLTVPYASYTNYHCLKVRNTGHYYESYGKVIVWVMSTYGPPGTNAKNEVKISLYGQMLDTDFQCPTFTSIPDQGAKLKRRSTRIPPDPKDPPKNAILQGPGAWNASNANSKSAQSVALAGEATSIDYSSAGSRSAEVDLIEIAQRWSIVEVRTWTGAAEPGDKVINFLFRRRAKTESADDGEQSGLRGNIRYFFDKFCYWRGSIEFKVLIAGSQAHEGRYMLAYYPKQSSEFNMGNARNALFVTSDVRGPQPTLVVPFTNQNWRSHTEDLLGRLCMFVVNPLTANAVTQENVQVVLLMRMGSDAKFYCPRHGEREVQYRLSRQLTHGMNNEGLDDQLTEETEPVCFINYNIKKVEIESESHTSLRNYFGRSWWHGSANAQVESFELSPSTSGHSMMSFFYAYWSGELDVTIMNDGTSIVGASHTYDEELDPEGVTEKYLMSEGCVFIKPGDMYTMLCPFYSPTPMRCLHHSNSLGYLRTVSSDRHKIQVFLAMSRPNFFFKMPMLMSARVPIGGGSAKALLYKNVESFPTEPEDDCVNFDDQGAETGQLVYIDRGLYRHYGVKVGNVVYHVDSENITKTLLNGEVSVVVDTNTSRWTPCSEEIETMGVKYLDSGILQKLKYSVDENCETWARELLCDDSDTQGHTFVRKLLVCIVLGMCYSVIIHDVQSGSEGKVMGMLSKLVQVIYKNFEDCVVKTIVRTIIRCLCYGVLFVYSPNLVTTGVLATLIVLDCTSSVEDKVKDLVDCMLNGSFRKCTSCLCDLVGVDDDERRLLLDGVEDAEFNSPFQDRRPVSGALRSEDVPYDDQGPADGSAKSFNTWTLAAKNASWWFGTLVEWFNWVRNKIFPPDIDEATKWLTENEENIATTLALADEHICLMLVDKSYAVDAKNRKKHEKLVDMLSGISLQLARMPKVGYLASKVTYVLNRLQQMTFESDIEWQFRPEPLGIWISGTAGVGKSFLAHLITKRIAQHFGWRSYSNATGSNHMDGYTNQEIHYFDDFGQNREEEDYGLICQLISSTPYLVPKADVSAKGTPYKGRLVIITTNRHDFSSTKLFDSEALARRFPIRLQIRPKEPCATNGRLDVSLAAKTKMLENGQCWQRNLRTGVTMSCTEEWVSLDFNTLIQEVIDELTTRESLMKMMNQGDSLFDDLKRACGDFDFDQIKSDFEEIIFSKPKPTMLQRCQGWVQKSIKDLKHFIDKNRTWFIGFGALASVISLASLAIPVMKTKNQSPYSGQPVTKMAKNFRVPLENQGSIDFGYVARRLVNLTRTDGQMVTALPLGGKQVLAFGHAEFNKVVYTTKEVDWKIKESYRVTVNDNEPMDLQVCEVDMPCQFKSIAKLLHPEPYTGDGYLLWKHQDNYYIQPVEKIRPYNSMVTRQMTVSTFGYVYKARTAPGSCGGILVANVNGSLKILGMHTSGVAGSGFANRINFMSDEGLVTSATKTAHLKYHQPRRTAYKPSPFFQQPELEPAVLSKHDPRLEEPVDDITKKAAGKYVGNVFAPPERAWNAAMVRVGDDLKKVIDVSNCMDYQQAISSEILHMDWQTSPGIKYRGFTKRQLVSTDWFKEDVEKQLDEPSTTFTTYLKDELRPIYKVRQGKTRAIEAADFDYTIAYRVVMGNIYKQIYSDRSAECGLAVGINPYVDFSALYDRLKQHCLCLDFSGFDGSLSPELMEAGADILASFHYYDQLAYDIHRPTIYSKQLVGDEEWSVKGGMCSGSPCTTVLNSICNNLAAYTVALACGADYDDLYIVSYGDDIIISTDKPFDISDLKERYKVYFGMTVTGVDKGPVVEWVPKDEAQFLKRSFKITPYSMFPVGVLDLDSMNNKIQWTKGDFDSQLESYCLELVLHGKDIYQQQVDRLRRINPSVNIPPFKIMERKMKTILYDFKNQGGDETGPMYGNNSEVETLVDMDLIKYVSYAEDVKFDPDFDYIVYKHKLMTIAKEKAGPGKYEELGHLGEDLNLCDLMANTIKTRRENFGLQISLLDPSDSESDDEDQAFGPPMVDPGFEDDELWDLPLLDEFAA